VKWQEFGVGFGGQRIGNISAQPWQARRSAESGASADVSWRQNHSGQHQARSLQQNRDCGDLRSPEETAAQEARKIFTADHADWRGSQARPAPGDPGRGGMKTVDGGRQGKSVLG